jgi:hypothetical protein
MRCPEDHFRRSIALYYYTVEKNPFRRASFYKAKPGNGNKRLFVKIDNIILAVIYQNERLVKYE